MKRIYIALVMVLLLAHFSCKKVPFFATEGSTLIISTDKSYLKTGGDRAQITIIGFNAEGEAIHDHTQVILQATLGQLNPLEVELMNGRGTVEFQSGEQSGVAEIMARSGNVEATPNPLQITIGSAALETITVSASPSSFNAGGGRSHIMVYTFDASGNLLSDIPVILSASAGTFDRGGGIYMTNSQGMVEDYLQTSQTAMVTAESGAKKAEVEVRVDKELDNQLPSANFVYSPTSPLSGQQVRFNGSLSTDADGYISSYDWDFGDGGGARGITSTHTYTLAPSESSKTFVVVLRVTDDRGGRGTTTQSITIGEGGSPIAQFTYSVSGLTVTNLDANLSSDPAGGTIVLYHWNFGDGNTDVGITPANHTYAAAGSYTITLTVTDNDGKTNSISKLVTVN